MNTITLICSSILFITIGLYFVQMALLCLFPKTESCINIPYSNDLNMYFFLVIPCLNEEKVIQETVKNMLKFNMSNLKIIIIDDDSEDNTINKILELGNVYQIDNDNFSLNEYNNENLILLKRHLPNARLGKGKSLNSAYYLISQIIQKQELDPNNCIMSVFDADVFISQHELERVAVILANEPKTGMVQSRVRMGTSTRDYFLPRMQDMEFFIIINRMQNLREYMGTVAAAGNGQFNRFSAIDPECPWTDCLLEDFDFSMRLLLNGWRTRLLQSERVYQQGVLDYKSFIKQRSRWCQGGMQCFHFFKDVWKSKYLSLFGKIEITFFLLLSSLTTISILALGLSFIINIILWLTINTTQIMIILQPYSLKELEIISTSLLTIAIVPGLFFGLWYYHDTKEKMLYCILAGLFLPIYNIMLAPAVVHALWKQYIKHDGKWIKTVRK